MSTSDIAVQLAVGLTEYTNFRMQQVQGFNPAVDANYQDIWAPGGIYPFPTALAANPMTIASTDAADNSSGTGARTVRVTGITTTSGFDTELVSLNGVTPVVLTAAFQRITDAIVVTAGSGQSNAGDISIVESGSGDVMSFIPIGYGRQQQVITSIDDPALVSLNVSVGDAAGAVSGGNVVQVRLETRTFLPALPNNPVWIVRDEFQVTDSAGQAQRTYNPVAVWGLDIGNPNNSFTDIRLRARCATTTALVQAVMSFYRAVPDSTTGFRSYPFP